MHDIIKVLRRRYPNIHIVIRPTRVQGEGAGGRAELPYGDRGQRPHQPGYQRRHDERDGGDRHERDVEQPRVVEVVIDRVVGPDELADRIRAREWEDGGGDFIRSEQLASDPQPVAVELRSQSCSSATGAYVACIDQFFALDGSCRTGSEFVNKPFTGLVAVPKTNFTSICTSGCQGVAPGPTQSTLPIALDREGGLPSGVGLAARPLRQRARSS